MAIDGVALALSGNASPFDIYMVVSIPTVPAGTPGFFLDLTTTGQATHFLNRISMIGISFGLQCARVGSSSATSYSTKSPLSANIWFVVECSHNPQLPSTTWNIGVVGAGAIFGLGGPFNPFTGGGTTDSQPLTLTLGRIGGSYEDDGEGNFNLNFNLAEVAIVNRVLGGSERTQKLRYLSRKYGLGLTF
jgi:hypothetical protein